MSYSPYTMDDSVPAPRRKIPAVGTPVVTPTNPLTPILAPRPGQPPAPRPGTTTTMAPVPNMPPGGTPEGPGFTTPPTTPQAPRTPLAQPKVPGTSVTPYGPDAGDLRGGMIAPSLSPRAQAAEGFTVNATNALSGFQYPRAIGAYADTFQNRLSTNPLQYQGVTTDVQRRAVDPRAQYTSVGTDVMRAPVNPTVRFNALDTNVAAGDQIAPQDSADLTKFREQRAAAAENVAGGPSRTEIAQKALEAFDLANKPQLENQIRSVGQQASKFGRLGMGETAVETLRPFAELQAQRAALAKQLGAETAAGEIQDRLNNLGASRALVGEEEAFGAGRRAELRGERGYTTDVASQNIGRQIGERDTALSLEERNRARQAGEADTAANIAAQNLARRAAERDTALGVAERNIGRDIGLSADEAALAERNAARRANERDTELNVAGQNRAADIAARTGALEAGMGAAGQEYGQGMDRFNAGRALESDIFGRESAMRNELRGERGFQQGMSQTDIENEMARRQLENQQYQQELDRYLRELALGYGVDPTVAYRSAAESAGRRAGGY